MGFPLVFLVLIGTLESQGFYPIGEQHGVKVFRRDTGRGIELGAEGEIAAPPEVVLAALTDYGSHPKWVRGVRESQVLKRADHALEVYQRLDLPVLVDRDFTLKVTWGEEGTARWLRFSTANQDGPAPRPGVVRVSTNDGSWYLEPTRGGVATHAIYRFHLDLAGSLPSWLGKGHAGKELPNLFDGIRSQVPYYRR
jgi:hypothetical protein